jgi:hypothetical protein
VINVLTVRNLYCVVKTDLNVWKVPVASYPQLAVSRDKDGLLFSFRVQKKDPKNLAVKGTSVLKYRLVRSRSSYKF